MIELDFHKIAEIFPMMDDAGLEDLAKDIKDNGLREAIWIDSENRIVDGRNRYRACGIAGVDPTLRQYKERDHGPLVAFVVSLNLKRRHLNESQRAAVGAKIANMAGGFHGNQYTSGSDQSTGPTAQVSNADAAKLLNVGETTIRRAKRVAREDPEAFEKVRKGEMTVNTAVRGLNSYTPPKPKVQQPMPEPRVRVVYDSEEGIAEQICTLCNRLSEVAQKVTPEGIWPKIRANVRYANNIDRSLSEAAHFLGDLHLIWAKEQPKKNAAG
jgi:hypothetical protein